MNNVISHDFIRYGVAPASDRDALVECVQTAIDEFGPLDFALTLVNSDSELVALAA